MNESKLSLAPSEAEMVTNQSGERFMPNPNLAKINTQSNKIYLAIKRASSNASSPPFKNLKSGNAVSNSKDLLHEKKKYSKAQLLPVEVNEDINSNSTLPQSRMARISAGLCDNEGKAPTNMF